jgi:hypothetical protein
MLVPYVSETLNKIIVETCKDTFLRLLVLVCHHSIQDITANKLGTFQSGKTILMLISFFFVKCLTQTHLPYSCCSRHRPRGYVAPPPETQRKCTVVTLGNQK